VCECGRAASGTKQILRFAKDDNIEQASNIFREFKEWDAGRE
jgi:hypothetical protein